MIYLKILPYIAGFIRYQFVLYLIKSVIADFMFCFEILFFYVYIIYIRVRFEYVE